MTDDTITLETERLILRPWRDVDLEPLARLMADPVVMEFFPSLLSRADSDSYGRQAAQHFVEHGYGKWVIERRGEPGFIGFSGLKTVTFDAPFVPADELGYRFLSEYWGNGYATEAGRAAVKDGFDRLGLERIVAFTAHSNQRSQAVLKRIGFDRVVANDFEHPLVPEGHLLRPHAFFEIQP